MKKSIRAWLVFGLATLAAGGASSAWADPGADLAKARNCMACHSVSAKVVGPAFKDVGAKYLGRKGAEDKLVSKVLGGGYGAWGSVPMPSNPQVSEAEARVLVKWILALK